MRFPKIVAWGVAATLVLIGVYVVGGSWMASRELSGALRVGAPTAQGNGWPTPQGPADIGYVGDPRQAYGYAFDAVGLAGELGVLPAWLVPPASGDLDRPWAIFVHGIGGRRENGYRFLPMLRDAGYPVLMISYRNDSGAPADPGGFYAFGLTEWRDLDAAVQYARGRGATSVVLVAESMGGSIAGQFLRRSDHAGAVSAIALDAPATDFGATLEDQLEIRGLPLAPVLTRGALWFSGLTMPVRLADAVTLGDFARFGKPLYLSHGFIDSVVPISSSDELVSRRGAATEYLRTRADHIQSWKVDPERYEASFRAWLSSMPADHLPTADQTSRRPAAISR
jgi:pimeloyl-ACP methyl ester carboxylesterase